MSINNRSDFLQLTQDIDDIVAKRSEKFKTLSEKYIENAGKLRQLDLKKVDKGVGSQKQDTASTPDAPNTTKEEVAERMGARVGVLEGKVSSNSTIVNILLAAIVISIIGLALQSFWILPEYKKDYVEATHQQKTEIEVLKKDNEKLKSDNDDLKVEVKYLRERFDRFIDTRIEDK